MLLLRKRRSHKFDGRARRQVSSRCGNRNLAASTATTRRRMRARQAWEECCGEYRHIQRCRSFTECTETSSRPIREQKNDRKKNRCVCEQRSALGARGPERLVEFQEMDGRAVCRAGIQVRRN